MKRSFVRGLARCLVGTLFLAQMAISAYACPRLSSAIDAGARMDQAQPMTAAPMPDCSDMAGATAPDSANLCAEHCKYGQQSDHASTLTVPAVILHALYTKPVVPLASLPGRAAALTAGTDVPVAASPPHAILHCVFRI